MAYTRPDTFTLPEDERMFLSQPSPLSRPHDSFSKGPDPLTANWNYDSAIDLFSLNTMIPETFPLEMSNDMMTLDPKDFPTDFFAPPPDISGFTISNHSGEDAASCGSFSSDLESDDQSWSPTCRVSPLDSMPMELPKPASRSVKSATRRRTATATQQQKARDDMVKRWSSSPEITPQDYPAASVSPLPTPSSPATATRKTTRSMSGDSNASTGPANTATGRNAAKRAAHNIIEKRYRTNMNAKFVALEKAMSGGIQKPTKGGSASLKKSEILTNAIAFMQELQEENKALQKELAMMKQNVVPNGMWRHNKGAEAFHA
ncbi:HLH DNA binding domain protein [Aspergillus japonicus CBS 114.51]|uniref:HLH DNA binding domain protein n=1 Tax=Aspergillus japonicus CBS 114.51 TaxID=1448312 RepID=A0A8T8X030_ASPJA|nr:HLH DNA binding domain protein [Aspergillus japonicus CBS 114.51]RAH81274.1 HLH DNA binding domain protein [Aspergillus japonicus CBS 114.51]